VPSVPSDVSDAGRSAAEDATLFPSDEQLSQRALWISFLIALGWTILGLGGALPLYLVSTPCLANSGPQSSFGGVYSTLQDLSLLRLLRLLDNGNSPTSSNALRTRATVNGKDATKQVNTRLIVLTVLVLVVGLLPALWKILKEFNRVVAYRKRWIEVRCQGKDMGWLSARDAPGFVGWGEKKLKDFILKTGLSSSLERNGEKSRKRQDDDAQLSHGEEAGLEVDIQSLFSIG
jgi:calcium permeable stress-gated cation channel